jgi:hypothetical protein
VEEEEEEEGKKRKKEKGRERSKSPFDLQWNEESDCSFSSLLGWQPNQR